MKRLLLAGGGHAHVEVLRSLRSDPLPDTEVLLLDAQRSLHYSGMLPGHIAGHYDAHEWRIDVAALCRAAGVTFVPAEVSDLDADGSRVGVRDGSVHRYDVLSLNVGSVPLTAGIAGASDYAVPVKPVPRLLAAWQALLATSGATPQRVAIVGGGAGGVELALAMHHGLRGAPATFSLVADAGTLLPGHAPRASRLLGRLLRDRGIALWLGRRAVKVEPGRLLLEDGGCVPADVVVCATGAAAPPWLGRSGLAVDGRGFVRVDETLRSVSHPQVFAAGDCASFVQRPLPKSGVYAVRQGPPLAANLRAALTGRRPVRYAPQQRALALIGTGDRRAVASWGPIAFAGHWVWRWKEHLDRRFVARHRAA